MTNILRSVCPFDCPDSCGFIVSVENGKCVGIKGDPDHPHSRGKLCAKMSRYDLSVNSPVRITTPLERCGEKGCGAFREVSWERAVKVIAEKWRDIISNFGAQAILPYSYAGTMGILQRNAGHPFFNRLAASRLERTICTPAKEFAWNSVMGNTRAIHPDEAIESDLIILWGINAASTSLQFMQRVAKARQNGAFTIGIDVYSTATLKSADRRFTIKPGTDGALALGIMHILTLEKRVDREYLEKNCSGFDRLEKELLPEFNPTKVSEITLLSESDIYFLAEKIASAKRPLIRLGGGISRYGNGAQTCRAIIILPALVGAYAKKGAGCFCGTSTGRWVPVNSLTREDLLPSPLPRVINMNMLGNALNEISEPPVKSLYVYHSNPASVAPDSVSVKKGLERDDLFTVVHERFMTDTALYADIILPATMSIEHADIYRAYGSYIIQRVEKIVTPPGDCKSNREVFALLASEMGFTEDIFQMSDNEVIDMIINDIAGDAVDKSRVDALLPTEFNAAQKERIIETESGKIMIENLSLSSPLPGWSPPHSDNDADKLPLKFMTAPSLYSLNSSFYDRDDLRFKQLKPLLMINPEDAKSFSVCDGELVTVENRNGAYLCYAKVTNDVLRGSVVSEGVWWSRFTIDGSVVNNLTSQRLTDSAGGSTFSDVRVTLTPYKVES